MVHQPLRRQGQNAVDSSDTRCCSGGFEFRCEEGVELGETFDLDRSDSDAIGWVVRPCEHWGVDI